MAVNIWSISFIVQVISLAESDEEAECPGSDDRAPGLEPDPES